MSKEQSEVESADILNAPSEEQLRDLLESEMMSDEIDVERIKRINSVLNEKTGWYPDCDVDEKWQEFASEHTKPGSLNSADISFSDAKTSQPVVPRMRKSLARVAVAAVIIVAVALFGGTITAQAFNIDIWNALAQWTSEIFQFASNSRPDNTTSIYSETAAEFRDLQAALDSYGITDNLVPRYLPVGYEQVDFFFSDDEGDLILASVFSEGTESIVIQYSTLQGSQFQKDDGDPETYEADGIQHYIIFNSRLIFPPHKSQSAKSA